MTSNIDRALSLERRHKLSRNDHRIRNMEKDYNKYSNINLTDTSFNNKTIMPTVYIGFDKKEETYYNVLKYSILKYASRPVNIVPLVQDSLRLSGLYRRGKVVEDGKQVDIFDKKPFSTDFSFSRFLVPFLNMHQGLALFMDCDMYVRSDILEIFDIFKDTNRVISCVQHNHLPTEKTKMDGKVQQIYPRKNWSSFMLWNCSHPWLQTELTISDVNIKSGTWLHSFQWCDEEHIGSINEEWNWLDNHSSPSINPKCVHFTTGGPFFRAWEPKRSVDDMYAKEWTELYEEMTQ